MHLSKQEEIVYNHIKKHKFITSMEAFDKGITRLSDKIYTLRNKGFDIETIMAKGKNRYGDKIQYAKYYLANHDFAENKEIERLGGE